jgi:hypothetical protein
MKNKSQISLNCPLCKNTFDDGRLIPCGITLCLKCIQPFIIDNKFKCSFCSKKEHELPINGFPSSPIIMELISKQNITTQRLLKKQKCESKQINIKPGPKSYKLKMKSIILQKYDHFIAKNKLQTLF